MGIPGFCSSGPLVAGALYVFITHCGWLANAAEPPVQNDAFIALRNFVQLIDSGPPPGANAAPISKTQIGLASTDDAYAALIAFSERIVADRSQSIRTGPKVAEAESLFDALREWGQQKGPNSKSSPAAPTPNGPIAGGTNQGAPIDATSVGTKVCVTCHAASTEQFNHTLMGRLAKTQKGKFECESCHGPGSAHVKAGGGRGVAIVSFRPDDRSRTAEENNAICLACHERGERTYWNGSTHETRGLMCSNCHTVMKQVSRKFALNTAFEPDGCYQCHKDRRAEIYFSSHMPVSQGKITCTDCHNPHGSATEAMLKQNSVNDNCYKCHAEKRGPFLWEHNPVRENCLNCHEAHGSTKPAMLKIQSPKLCAECHGFNHGSTNLLGPTNSRFIFNKGCSNCHSKVHGSNHPSGMFFLR